MTYWTNPALEGRYGVASSFVLNDVQYPSGWLRTASEQEIADLGFVVDDTPTPPFQPPLRPIIYAVGNFTVSDMDISGIDTAVNFSAALWLDVGTYLVLFSATQPNTQYLAKAYSGTSQALVVEKGEDYLIINASNASGPYDPAEFSLEVIRVQ